MIKFHTQRISIFTLYIGLIIGIISCSKNDNPKPNNDEKDNVKQDIVEQVILLHVNDLHANIDAFPKISSFVNSVRDTSDNVFLLSAGDIFSGNPMVDMYENPGYPIIDLMNQLEFDVSVIGNHEFDYGQKKLNNRVEQANFPFICANIDASKGELKQPDAFSTLTTKEGYEVHVVGLVEANSKVGDKYIPSTHPDKVEGCFFPYYKTEIKNYNYLKSDTSLYVILSHLGYGSDNTLAEDNKEIDIIIGGHSHKIIEQPSTVNNSIVCQAGSYGRYVGVVHVTTKNKKVVKTNAYLVNMENYPKASEEIQNIVDDYNNNPALNEVIGTNLNELNSREEIGCLMTDAITWKFDVDIAFQNSGGIRSNFYVGDILVKDVYRNDPFGNEVITFNLSYNELSSLILNSRPGDLKVSGIHIIHKQNGGIELTDYDNNPIDTDKTYKVGMNSYIASAYSFEHSQEGVSTEITSADALIEFIDYKKNIDYMGVNRIFYE